MVQDQKLERYRGVLCGFCRQPIPLPTIVASAEAARPGVDQDSSQENISRSFHIRCRVCEKEASYRAAEITDFEGRPRARSFRYRSGASMLRDKGPLTRAANG
jgi:hypothetical protein